MNTPTILKNYTDYLMGTYLPQQIVIKKGYGCTVTDSQGNQYLDFISGVAVNSLGYNHPVFTQRLKQQIDKLIHISNLLISEEQVTLAQRLAQKFRDGKVFFCNSGAESIEGAIKLARKWGNPHGRNEIITMEKSFHGRTLAAITATGQPKYQKDLDPLPQGFSYAQFGDIDSIKARITPKTVAVLIEPIQGEGGINLAPQEFWDQLALLCEQHKLLLILDEIQTGTGRTGTFFAHKAYNLNPDIVCLAKGLGGGIPIGAMIAKPAIAASFQPGDHASTFGGNPLACAAALAVLDIFEAEDLLKNVNQMSEVFVQATASFKTNFPFVKAIRGKGLMWGIELDDTLNGAEFVKEAAAQGLLLNCIGGHILRIAPPLVIHERDFTNGIKILEGLFKKRLNN